MPPHKPHHPPPHEPHHSPPHEPRRPGRPPSVGADTPLNVKISQPELQGLDDCAARLGVSRAEAVRQGLRLLQDAVEREDHLPRPRPPHPVTNSARPAWSSADASGVAAGVDNLYADLVTVPSSIMPEELMVLLQSVVLATGDHSACLYFLDCLRLHALATGGVLASREAAARFAGIIQARGGKGKE